MSDEATTTPDRDPQARRSHQVAALFLLFWAYFSFNLVFRWLRSSLLFGHAKDGWAEPSALTTLYQLVTACLPVALWAWAAYAVCVRFPRLCNRVLVVLVLFAVTAVVELDMNWFLMSKMHITADDAVAFLTGSPDDFGMDASEIWRFVKLLGRHAVFVLVLIPPASVLLGNLFFRWNLFARAGLRRARVGVALALLVVADSAWVGYCTRHDTGQYAPSQWGFVAYANPTRARPLDGLWQGLFRQQPDLREANASLAGTKAAAPEASGRPLAWRAPAAGGKYNVVVIAVESFNARLVARTDMPFWKELSKRSLRLGRHYSTGNCTQYGVLGLLYGSPPVFYDGALGRAESPFLERFAKRGYATKRISNPLTNFRYLGNYLGPFTEPEVELREEWSLVPQVCSALAGPGPHFLFVFYNKTHYPYRHADRYNRFQPEVPEDYHFQSWDAARHAPEIVNRYKNALLEFDDWLRAVVKTVDLERTILVVTGDHGEEFFESGRLGHCSYLNDAQTRVPCLVHVPGRAGGDVGEVTSHADILPTVVEALGWDAPVPCFGESVLHRVGQPCAVVAQSNQHHRPAVWAVVSPDRKAIVEGHNQLRVIALFDREDRKVEFREDPQGWSATFAAVQRFQRALLRQVAPGLPKADEPYVSR